MRLICPNCGAQYDVSDDAIPATGRDVECSNCGHSWFQEGTIADIPVEAITPPAQDDRPVRRSVDASIAEILRQEAAREQQLRDSESTASPAEPQEPPAVDEPDDQPAPPPAAEEKSEIAPVAPPIITPRPASALRSDPNPREMPSMSEINASLRAQSRSAAPAREIPTEEQEAISRHGFRRGFAVVLLIFAVLLAPYIFADQITSQFPQSQEIMTAYVATIDGLRLTINQYAAALAGWAAEMTS